MVVLVRLLRGCGFRDSARAGWLVAGLSLYLLRRCIRWALQSTISIDAPRRFACLRNVWYLAGSLLAYWQKPWRKRSQVVQAVEAERRLSQAKP